MSDASDQLFRPAMIDHKCLKIYEPGETVITEGEEDYSICILWEGRLGVFKQGQQIAEMTLPGTVFGEMSAIMERPRTATICAVEKSYVIRMAQGLDQLIFQHPKLLRAILKSMAFRLEQAGSDLAYCRENMLTLETEPDPSAGANPNATITLREVVDSLPSNEA